MAYATTDQVAAGFRDLTDEEITICIQLLEEAAIIIDTYNVAASDEAKSVVSCRMVRRCLADSGLSGMPLGATQGSISALGYSQSWTVSSGSTGELYLSSLEKKLLGRGNKIGARSPLEDMVVKYD